MKKVIPDKDQLIKQQNEINLQGVLILLVAMLDVVRLNLSGNFLFWAGLFLALVVLMRVVGLLIED
mgnify:FL=1